MGAKIAKNLNFLLPNKTFWRLKSLILIATAANQTKNDESFSKPPIHINVFVNIKYVGDSEIAV